MSRKTDRVASKAQLHPDILKLDLGLIRDIDTDPARQALAWALGWFAQRTGAAVVAAGVETDPERQP